MLIFITFIVVEGIFGVVVLIFGAFIVVVEIVVLIFCVVLRIVVIVVVKDCLAIVVNLECSGRHVFSFVLLLKV